jgi:hypothetical protein
MLGGENELVDRGRFRLKGFPERWRLYEVIWQGQEASSVSAPVLVERTPFVRTRGPPRKWQRLCSKLPNEACTTTFRSMGRTHSQSRPKCLA